MKNMVLGFLVLVLSFSTQAFERKVEGEKLDQMIKLDKKVLEEIRMTPHEIKTLNGFFDRELMDFRDIIRDARDGDVVGNGGGHLEGQIQFYLSSLSSFIRTALNQNMIRFSDKEEAILNMILKNIAEKQPEVLYVDGNPNNFFNDQHDGEVRIAKTGFSSDYPIFINRTLAYKIFKAEEKFNSVALLVHELGHQAGIKSHSLLDTIGSKVSIVTEFNRSNIRYDVYAGEVSIDFFNHGVHDSRSSILVNYFNQTLNINSWDHRKLQAKCGADYYVGFQIENPHWVSRIEVDRKYRNISFGGWMNIVCVQQMGFSKKTVSVDFEVKLRMGNTIEYKTIIK
ncbi:MAG: hypothetical protein GY909_08725 [Oligoflexia bacterium]|nr:hypothetical protein [Oligoflexia bacterium]